MNIDRMLLLTIFFVASCSLSFLLTAVTIKIANKIGFVNKPNKIVINHKKSVAYGGGIAIAIALSFAIIVAHLSGFGGLSFVLGIYPVIILGIIDDTYGLPPSYKFYLQCLSIIPFLFFYDVNFTIKVFAGLFIIYSMNSWNLIDVMDGLTGWVSVFAFSGIAITTFLVLPGSISITLVSLALVGVVMGFLFWNKYPAKIFLGDTGSLLLGTLFSMLVLEIYRVAPKIIVVVLILGSVPYFELIFLIIERTKKKIPFFRGSPDHFALRMLQKGFTVKQIITKVKIYLFAQVLVAMLLLNLNFYFCFISTITIISLTSILAFNYFHSLPVSKV
jgi:UDP-GlcNAc:undecaprenyl-phosphate GlcNAc-1-phosphate transferase